MYIWKPFEKNIMFSWHTVVSVNEKIFNSVALANKKIFREKFLVHMQNFSHVKVFFSVTLGAA